MKICFVSLGFLPDQIGGGEVYAFRLAQALTKQGQTVTVIRRLASQSSQVSVLQSEYVGIPVFGLNSKPPASAWAHDKNEYEWAIDFFRETNPHVVHVFLFAGMLSIVRAAKALSIPVVLTALDFGMFCSNFLLLRPDGGLCDGTMEFQKCEECQIQRYSRKHQVAYKTTAYLPSAAGNGLRKLANSVGLNDPFLTLDVREALKALRKNWSNIDSLVDVVITPSNIMRSMYIANGFPQERLHSVVYGVDANRVEKSPSDRKIRFGYIGRLHAAKGVNTLLEAFGKLTDPDVSLSIFGPLPDEYSTDPLLLSAKRDSRIIFRGSVDQANVRQIHESIDVLVVPSVCYENAPIVVLEALAYGTPVVASDVDGIKQFVRHEVNGLIFERANPQSLQQALERLVTQPELLESLNDSHPNVTTLAQNAEQLLGIYRTLTRII